MNGNTKERKRKEMLINNINSIMVNREVECDEEWWNIEEVQNIIDKMLHVDQVEFYTSKDLNIICNEFFVFISYKKIEDQNAFESAFEKAFEDIDTKDGIQSVGIICIVNNMKHKAYLENLFSKELSKKIQKWISAKTGKKRKKITYTYILDRDFPEQEIKLKNVNRFEFVQMPPVDTKINFEVESPKAAKLKGYVTSIDLYQLVEIYNLLGNELFKKNVRYGIGEQFEVDRAIKDTLEKEPERFWFKNNGITLLIENKDFQLNRVGEVFIDKVRPYEKLTFSVVNGAQTITAAASYFNTCDYEKEKYKEKQKDIEEKIKRSKEAKVLLRILHVDSTCDKNEANAISVALNRQKPIKIEDMAFTSVFIQSMCEYLEGKQKNGNGSLEYFVLERRGEENGEKNGMSLVEFARARKACVRKPGEARSKGANVLLKGANETNEEFAFSDKDIFIEEWIEDNAEQDKIFAKHYKAVYFASTLAKLYGSEVTKITCEDRAVNTVMMNGKWYFVSYFINLLNNFQTDEKGNPDFSDFDTLIDISSFDMSQLIKTFAEEIVDLFYAKQESSNLDSNIFKKEELFKRVYENLDYEKYVEIINFNMEKEIKVTNSPQSIKNEREEKKNDTKQENKKASANKVTSIKVLGNEKVVKDPTEAIEQSYALILKENEHRIDDFCRSYPNILTFDENKDNSYHRNKKIVWEKDGRKLYLGVSINFERKCDIMTDLCEFMKCKPKSVVWFHEGEEIFSN